MSVVQPWLLLEEMHQKMVADALGGDVWIAEGLIHWQPTDSAHHITIPYRSPNEPFDVDEYVAALQAGWARCGARL